MIANRAFLTRVLIISAGIAGSGIACAQANESGAAALEEVIVTAQRRSESLLEVPASITAISGDTLRAQNIASPEDLASVVHGLEVAEPYGQGSPAVYTVRGVSANDFTPTQGRPIAMYLDEAVRSAPLFEWVPFYDLERVEVLRGPQGSLYGRNASGGAINIITARPGFDTNGYIRVGVGNYSRREAEGAAQHGLIDNVLAVRAAFTYVRDDGTVHELSGLPNQNQTDVFVARVGILYQPAEELSALLRVFYSRSGGVGYGSYAKDVNTLYTGGVDRAGLGFFDNRTERRGQKNLWDKGINLQVTWNLNDSYEVKSITALDRGSWISEGDDDGLPVSIIQQFQGVRNSKSLSQEFRIASTQLQKAKWQAGVSYVEDAMDFSQRLTWWNDPALGIQDPFGLGLPCCGLNLSNSFTQKREGTAGYIRFDFENAETLSTFAAARYSRDKVAATKYNSNYGATVPGQSPGFDNALLVDQAISDTFSKTTFEAGVRWHPSSNVSAYATFKQGYRAGAINAQAFFSPSEVGAVRPEEVNGFEVGIKSRLGQKVEVDVAAFYLDYKNQQFVNADPATGLLSLQNAEKATIKGVEWDAQWQVHPQLRLSGGLTLLNPTYGNAVFSGVRVDGNQLIDASKVSANLAGDWKVLSTKGSSVTLHVDASSQSAVYYDAFNSLTTRQGSYTVANAHLSFEHGKYFATLWGRNLAKTEYFAYALDLQSLFGLTYAIRGMPRTFGLQVGMTF